MTRAKKPAPPSKSALIEDQNLLDYTIGAMTYYGKHTIQNRALPDFRDGLIPVQRRLLWAAFKMGSRDAELVKSARIIGDTIGRYHPHGDSAAYTALITLVQSPTKLVLGSGNWGSFDDPKSAAAMRYTEARLSAFARKCFFDPYQIRATDLISNFDGTATEPVVLHSNLPVAMLLGGTGIAVGVTYGMPSYTPQSVAKLTAMALSGKTITPRMCVEHLEFMFRWGGHVHPDHYKDGTLAELYKTGQATLYVVSDHAYENKRLVISGVAPGVNVAKAMESSAEYEGVKRVADESEMKDIEVVIEFSDKLTLKEQRELADTIVEQCWTGRLVARTNFTERKPTEDAQLGGAEFLDIEFQTMPIPKLIMEWAKYRLGLEKTLADIEAGDLKEDSSRMELNILAASNFEVIRKSLLQEDSEAYLVKNLKITADQARYILDKTLRSLKSTNIDACKKRISDNTARLKQLAAIKKDPSKAVIEKIRGLIATITE